jgi:uncharacterized protein
MMNTPIELQHTLENWFKPFKNILIALSGGIDSSLVAFVARKKLGRENVAAVISSSASVKTKDLVDARTFCDQFDISLHEIDAEEINNPEYRKNPVNRCFFCKSALYSELARLVSAEFPGYIILNGNNFSDMSDYRPGLQAADNHNIRSPLAECKFTKEDIRILSRYYGLPNWNKPASPCLSSRFPYGETINVEKLRMVEKAEDLLNEFGFNDVRVRYSDKSARIEVPSSDIAKLKRMYSRLEPSLLSVGFESCDIDPEGLVSGKLNRRIKK